MIDAIAFKELYKTVYQDLYRFALCMMHHPQDAEDAVSEAVFSAMRTYINYAKKKYSVPGSFRFWQMCRRKLKSRETNRDRAERRSCFLPHTVTDSAQMWNVLFLFSMKTSADHRLIRLWRLQQ